jgi:hypothetical protein
MRASQELQDWISRRLLTVTLLVDFHSSSLSSFQPSTLSRMAAAAPSVVRAVGVLKQNDVAGTVLFEQDAKVRAGTAP